MFAILKINRNKINSNSSSGFHCPFDIRKTQLSLFWRKPTNRGGLTLTCFRAQSSCPNKFNHGTYLGTVTFATIVHRASLFRTRDVGCVWEGRHVALSGDGRKQLRLGDVFFSFYRCFVLAPPYRLPVDLLIRPSILQDIVESYFVFQTCGISLPSFNLHMSLFIKYKSYHLL